MLDLCVKGKQNAKLEIDMHWFVPIINIYRLFDRDCNLNTEVPHFIKVFDPPKSKACGDLHSTDRGTDTLE